MKITRSALRFWNRNNVGGTYGTDYELYQTGACGAARCALLKNAQAVKDKNIPITLGAAGIVLAALWVISTSTITGWQSVVLALFTAIVQGVIAAGCSVYVNQIVKQKNKTE